MSIQTNIRREENSTNLAIKSSSFSEKFGTGSCVYFSFNSSPTLSKILRTWDRNKINSECILPLDFQGFSLKNTV